VPVAWLDTDTTFGLALLGSYGTGKSSVARRLATVCAERYEAKESYRIPLLIELRHFSSDVDVAQLITHHVINVYGLERLSFERFQVLNRAGKFVIILDGFDEMKHGSTRESIAYTFSEINQLSGGKSKVILCGRPTLFEDESEQMAFLAGAMSVPLAHHAAYLSLQLNQFTDRQLIAALRRYALAAPERERERLLNYVDQLSTEITKSVELRELLARPVHIQMLMRILPTLEGPVTELSRAELYQQFIGLIIGREASKATRARVQYSIDQRRDFASRLAVEMVKLGDARSIRQSAITETVLKGFRRPGVPLDAIRRELVSACFLERKPPDVLYFGHKSFGEYLVAERVAHVAKMSKRTDALGIEITPEIASFVSELLTLEDWVGILVEADSNGRLFRTFLKAGTTPKIFDPAVKLELFFGAFTQKAVITKMKVRLPLLPAMVQFQLAELIEQGPPAVSSKLAPLAQWLLESVEDLVAVHAYRALVGLGEGPSIQRLEAVLGKERLKKWREYRWIMKK
jgi:hypothetical protein